MFKGICTVAICIALSTFGSNNSAQAASTYSGDKTVSAVYFQDSTGQRSNMGNKGKTGGRMNSGKMDSDSTGKMGNMKGKNSGGYKNKGMGKSKMDTTNNR